MSSLKTRRLKHKLQEAATGYLFMLPALTVILVFVVIPSLYAFAASFTDYHLLRPAATKFVGLRNYVWLITSDTVFRVAVKNTLYFVLLVVPLQVGIALGLAILVNRQAPGMSFYRTAYFSPVVTSLVVISVLWTFLYDPEVGPINAALKAFGLRPLKFLYSPRQAMPSIVVMSAWQGAGCQMVLLLSGLQQIPRDLYEAAIIDGAGRSQVFRYVTIPALSRVLSFVILITTIWAFKLFVQPYVMTRGGPQNATWTLIIHLYDFGFTRMRAGYASAVGVVFFLMVLAISLSLKRVLSLEGME